MKSQSFSRLYQGYVAKNKLDTYGRRMLELPMPKYIVFYIGVDDIGESRKMWLSDVFLKQAGEVPALECVGRPV